MLRVIFSFACAFMILKVILMLVSCFKNDSKGCMSLLHSKLIWACWVKCWFSFELSTSKSSIIRGRMIPMGRYCNTPYLGTWNKVRKCETGKILELSDLHGPLHEPCKGKWTISQPVQMTRQEPPLVHLQGKPNGHLNGPFGSARGVEPSVETCLGQVEHATAKGAQRSSKRSVHTSTGR